jgi:2-polyprenyl-3-methyl-5-hydroxy-6-metoxy-1,4-benzoquinol methylase
MPWKWEHEITSKYILPNFKILEVGCAEGDFMKRIKDSLKVEVTGLELNQKAISLARQNNLNVLPQLIQEHSREFIDYYDVVCSFQVLEHISDVHSFIDNKIKCLKKGGKLIVAVPNNDSFIQFDLENILNLPPHHMGLWNKKSLVNLTKIFPLSVEKIYLEPIQTYHLEWFHKVTHQRNYRLSQKKFIKLIMNKLPIFLKWRFEKLLFKFTKLLMPKFGHTILIVYNKK